MRELYSMAKQGLSAPLLHGYISLQKSVPVVQALKEAIVFLFNGLAVLFFFQSLFKPTCVASEIFPLNDKAIATF